MELTNNKIHNLKIKGEYAKLVFNGAKPFELRKNDRDFKAGDFIVFDVIDDPFIKEVMKDQKYLITYVLKNVPQYGLDKDYCILGIISYEEYKEHERLIEKELGHEKVQG